MTRAERAREMERQAAELDRDRSGGWRERAQRREGAARLRRRAWGLRPAPEPGADAELPF